jgi:hypothetical protein
MSSEVKQLIVVAEGTAALGPYWQTIVSDYLEKIIRSFCGSELNGERNPVSTVELSLVIFNSHGSYCGTCCASSCDIQIQILFGCFLMALVTLAFVLVMLFLSFILLSLLGTTEWLDKGC